MYTALRNFMGGGGRDAQDPHTVASLSKPVASTNDRDLQSLEIPDETLGMHVLAAPEDETRADLDVVFLHGLGGDSFSTWTEPTSKILWPAAFLSKSPKFEKARIMTYGYNSRIWAMPFERRSTERLFTFGEELITSLRDSRAEPYQRTRPLMLVGHSLGGIVIKSAILYGKMNPTLYREVVDSVKALVFFGTPHQGADVAAWAGHLSCLSKAVGVRSNEILDELKTWSPTLLELNRLFSETISDLMVTTFFELESTHGIRVVDEGSARVGNLKREVSQPLHRNHLSICRFAKESEADYKKVKGRLEAVVVDIRREKESESIIMPEPDAELQRRLEELPSI